MNFVGCGDYEPHQSRQMRFVVTTSYKILNKKIVFKDYDQP